MGLLTTNENTAEHKKRILAVSNKLILIWPDIRGGARGWPGVVVATTDLSLATLLKTAVFVPFFLTRNAFIKMRNRCNFLHPHQTRLFRHALQFCLSTRRESNECGKGTPTKWALVEQWDAVRLYVRKTNFPILSAVIINKRTRNYEHTTVVLSSVKS